MIGAPLLYRTLLRLLRAAGPLVGSGGSKVARGVAGRRHAAASMVAWASAHRAGRRPGVWLHAPSVGEGLQARAVLEALQARGDDLQSVFTHFSPSAEVLAREMPTGWAGYLPWDLPDEVAPALDAVRPDVVAFTKTEVWPTLAAQASARGIPVALVAGTLTPGAGRGRWPARSLLRSTWARMSLVAGVDDADAQGFQDLGVPAVAVHVTGDPGVDAALARAETADPQAPYLRPFADHPRPTVVAGSIWPSDLKVLVPALRSVRGDVPSTRVVLVPHEPTPSVVADLLDQMEGLGWKTATLDQVERSGVEGVDAVVVERVGVLSALYTVAQVAYVGGGFHGAGLHSVLEPAAAGVPVTFGPGHGNARAAVALLHAEGAREAADSAALARVLQGWLADSEAHVYAGHRARGYIDAHRGAAHRTAALLTQIMY